MVEDYQEPISQLKENILSVWGKLDVDDINRKIAEKEELSNAPGFWDDNAKATKVMNDIKSAGFLVSVDDFGSGYSSLNLLKSMPADVIKLDKDFLSNAPENQKENIIIQSVIEMAKKLKIKTVAEGVETKLQSDMLKSIGCDIAQGFFYAKPMKESDFLDLLLKSLL